MNYKSSKLVTIAKNQYLLLCILDRKQTQKNTNKQIHVVPQIEYVHEDIILYIIKKNNTNT